MKKIIALYLKVFLLKDHEHTKLLEVCKVVLKNTIKKMEGMLIDLGIDLRKAFDKGNKAAAQRVRTGTITFAKLAKQYRKESMIATKKGSIKGQEKKAMNKKRVNPRKTCVRKKKVAQRSKGSLTLQLFPSMILFAQRKRGHGVSNTYLTLF